MRSILYVDAESMRMLEIDICNSIQGAPPLSQLMETSYQQQFGRLLLEFYNSQERLLQTWGIVLANSFFPEDLVSDKLHAMWGDRPYSRVVENQEETHANWVQSTPRPSPRDNIYLDETLDVKRVEDHTHETAVSFIGNDETTFHLTGKVETARKWEHKETARFSQGNGSSNLESPFSKKNMSAPNLLSKGHHNVKQFIF